ncbi:MAG: hypothetical protein IKW83_08840 [Muribaculaceae bacterium]|nr:hypothetical protein [Muribaculaceae bacterium]
MKSKKLILLFVSVFLTSILMSSCKPAAVKEAAKILSKTAKSAKSGKLAKTGKLCKKVVKSYNDINDYAEIANAMIEGFDEDQVEEGGITAGQANQLYAYDIYYGNPGDFVSTLKFADNVPPQMQQQYIQVAYYAQQLIQSMIQQGQDFSYKVTKEVVNEDGSVFIYNKMYLNGQLINDDNTPDIMVIGDDGYWYQLITYEMAAEAIQSYLEAQQQMSYHY